MAVSRSLYPLTVTVCGTTYSNSTGGPVQLDLTVEKPLKPDATGGDTSPSFVAFEPTHFVGTVTLRSIDINVNIIGSTGNCSATFGSATDATTINTTTLGTGYVTSVRKSQRHRDYGTVDVTFEGWIA